MFSLLSLHYFGKLKVMKLETRSCGSGTGSGSGSLCDSPRASELMITAAEENLFP